MNRRAFLRAVLALPLVSMLAPLAARSERFNIWLNGKGYATMAEAFNHIRAGDTVYFFTRAA